MVDRIKNVMEYKEMTKSSFARAIGIDPSRMTHIFNGHNEPTLDMVRRIVVAFPDISSEWLISGIGDMVKTEVMEVPVEKPQQASVIIDKVDNMQQTSLFDDDLFGPATSEQQVESELISEDDTVELSAGELESEQVVELESIPEVDEVSQVDAPVVVPQKAVVAPMAEESKVLRPAKPAPQPVRSRPRTAESHNSNVGTKRERISNSQVDKKIVKIVFFYDDHSFEEYRPN